ncbi:MAG: ester cyclase [Gemmatimonadota bacterium]|jgi:steroid delta-isomerase-like uncharacterized protein
MDDVTTGARRAHEEHLRHMLECLNAGDIDGFVEGLAPHYVRHCQAMPPDLQEIHGRDSMAAWLRASLETFPDYREEIDWLVHEGDHVAWRTRARGTMTGAMGTFPGTGKTMDLMILGMHRFEGGRIAETWTAWDNVAVLTQLGLMPGE